MIYESDYYVGSDLNGDSLSHHGVPHQKWGVKNGPPYPIKRGHDVNYNVGKMSAGTKATLQKTGKIVGEKVTNAAKTVVKKTSSSFQKWKENTKMDLATKDTDSAIMKRWQKKQLRISDMSNQELQQRIDRKKLEETYKHALRGDFSAPTTWGKSAKDAGNSKQGQNGKAAADGILAKIGTAAVDGLAKGLSSKIEQSMTAKAKAKVARKEARKNAIEDVMREAAKERAQYKSDQRNERWKERQDWKNQQRYNDGAMDPLSGWTGETSSGDSSFRSNRQSNDYGSYYAPTNSTGLIRQNRSSGNYYYASPGSWTVR